MKPREITPYRASLLVAERQLIVRPVDGRLVLEPGDAGDQATTGGPVVAADTVRRFFADVVASAERIVPFADQYSEAQTDAGADSLVDLHTDLQGEHAKERSERGVVSQVDRFFAVLPDPSIRWLTDPIVVYELLAGNITAGEDAFTGARTRRVELDVTRPEAFADAARDGRLWVCRAEWRGDSGEPIRSSWLVEDRNDTETAPSQQLGRALHRLRDSLIALGGEGCRVGITRRGASTVNDVEQVEANQRVTRIVTEGWTAYWPIAGFRRTVAFIAGERTQPRSGDDRRPIDALLTQGALRIVFSSVGYNGPAALSYRRPRTAAERRGAYATSTMARLVASGYTATHRLVDSAYRSGDRFALFVTVYRYSGGRWRAAFDKALGARRKDALPNDPLPIQRVSSSDVSIWDRYAIALERFLDLFSGQIHRPGGAIDASTMDIVSRYYLRPRTDAMRSVWERTCRDTRIDALLEEGRLSILRDLGRRYPRTTLVEAVAGRPEGTKRRIASIFSRNGRAIFLEDVEALEAAITRRDIVSWERLLSSQGVLSKIAQRIQV